MERAARETKERLHEGLMGMPSDILYSIIQLVEEGLDHVVGAALASTCNFFYSRLGGLEGSRRQHVQYIEAWDWDWKRADKEEKHK